MAVAAVLATACGGGAASTGLEAEARGGTTVLEVGGPSGELLTCRELGGGFRYERRADGISRGLPDGVGDVDIETRREELRANGWTDELYDVLWHLGRDHQMAAATGFEGTADELEDLTRRARDLLSGMPECAS